LSISLLSVDSPSDGSESLAPTFARRCVAVGWVYGADRFAADTLEMTGVRIYIYVERERER